MSYHGNVFVPVSQALRENTYPFLALVVLRETRMTVVAKVEGPIGRYYNIHVRAFILVLVTKSPM